MADETLLDERTGFDVLLADGSTARIRAIRPEDAATIRDLHARLTPESLRLRFFVSHPALTDGEVDRLLHLRGPDGLALVVERADRLVAVAEYDRETGSEEAEVAFVVDDAYQGRGIGTILLEHLAAEARRHGIRRFVAETLSENLPMQAVLRDAGFARKVSWDGGELHVVLDIAPSPEAVAAADERDRIAVVRSMARLLRPRSIAVVGAARAPGTIGHEIVRNLVNGGFEGPLYPVNPSATHIASIPCWPCVEAVPGEVDLAIVAVPAAVVTQVVEECGRKGVGALVVISAGFAELGTGGAAEQDHIARLAHANGMRMVGPNCFGIVNTDPEISMNATFAADAPTRGTIGFASQSGGLGIAILAEAKARGIGLSTFVSMGNKADVSGNDLLTWWEQDGATEVILLYLESFGNPRKFSRIARRIGRSKPIVVVKSGRTRAGSLAASSHTAALASSEQAVDALFRQTGVLRVDTIEDLFDVGEILVQQPLPRGRRVAIVSNAGGPGVQAADACIARGLSVPELSGPLQEALGSGLPSGAGLRNPIDLVASATAPVYERTLGILLSSDEIDAVVAICTPPLTTRADDIAEAVVRAVGTAANAGSTTPLVAAFLGSPTAAPLLRSAARPVPCFVYPESAVRALSHVIGYGEWRSRPEGVLPSLDGIDANEARRRLALATHDENGWVTGREAMDVLAAYGVPTATTAVAEDADTAVKVAEGIGFPVALKARGAGLLHKTEAGGVALGLRSPGEVHDAFGSMRERIGPSMTGVDVQAMAGTGVETIVGFVQDPSFGPQVLFGLGGTVVELLGDHASRLAPLTGADAREMVLGLRGTPLLTGFRGSEPVDLDAVVDTVLRVGRLAEDLPEISEADLNPVIVSPAGAVTVDARFRISPGPTEAPEALHHLR